MATMTRVSAVGSLLVASAALWPGCSKDPTPRSEQTTGRAETPEQDETPAADDGPGAGQGRVDSGTAKAPSKPDAGPAARGHDASVSADAAVVEGGAALANDGGQESKHQDAAAPPACDPKDKTPPAKIIQFSGKDTWLWEDGAKWYEPEAVTDTDTPNTGPYKITIELDPTLPTFTIYRPEVKDRLLPILAYAEGGCLQDGTETGEFLKEIASYGFLIIADGDPGGTSMSPQDDTRQKTMIDWALKENERPCSTYYHTLNTEKIAVHGGSCGGLMTFHAAPDPRITTAVLWNSGLFERDPKLYDSLHAPMAIFDGGKDDPAYANATEDVAAITKVPVFFANDKRGHAGYQWDDNGGEAAKVGVAWFNWHLLGDMGPTGKGMFVGPDCGMCTNKKVWTDTAWKNAELIKD